MGKDRNHSRLVYWFGSNFYVPLVAAVLILFLGISSLAYGVVGPKEYRAESEYGDNAIQKNLLNIRIPFEVNQGQINDKNIRYHASTMGGSVYIDREGYMTYQFPQTKTAKNQLLVERLINASKAEPRGISPSRAKVNYIKGMASCIINICFNFVFTFF